MLRSFLPRLAYQVQYAFNRDKFYPTKPVDKHVLDNLSNYVDCTDLDPYDVFAHLYNSSRPMGLGVLEAKYVAMNQMEAKDLLDISYTADYIYGRPIKTSFNNWPFLHPRGYDNYNGGPGTMQRLIKELRETNKISTKVPEECPEQELKKLAKSFDQYAEIFNNNKK